MRLPAKILINKNKNSLPGAAGLAPGKGFNLKPTNLAQEATPRLPQSPTPRPPSPTQRRRRLPPRRRHAARLRAAAAHPSPPARAPLHARATPARARAAPACPRAVPGMPAPSLFPCRIWRRFRWDGGAPLPTALPCANFGLVFGLSNESSFVSRS